MPKLVAQFQGLSASTSGKIFGFPFAEIAENLYIADGCLLPRYGMVFLSQGTAKGWGIKPYKFGATKYNSVVFVGAYNSNTAIYVQRGRRTLKTGF